MRSRQSQLSLLLVLTVALLLAVAMPRLLWVRAPVPPPPGPQDPGGAASGWAQTEVDRALSKLHRGNLALRAPTAIGYGDTQSVRLLLSGAIPARDLARLLSASEAELVEAHHLRIADVMQAHLTGDGFTITPITPETEPVGGAEPTEWEWEVTPKRFGQLSLHLSVNAVLTLDGAERTRSVQTFHRAIRVTVQWPETVYAFLGRYWQWLSTVLLLPLLGYLWKRRKRPEPPGEVEQT